MLLPPPVIGLLERQHGCVARFQMLEHLTRGATDGAVASGVLVTVQRGVYRVAGCPVTPQMEAMAAVLRARPKARVTGPRVLGLLNVDGFRPDDPFEVLTTAGRRLTNVVFPHRTDPFPDEPRVFVGPIPTTSPTASLVDSGRFVNELGSRRLRLGHDASRWRGLTTTDDVLQRCRLLGAGDAGAAVFLDLHRDAELVPESEGERQLGRIVRDFHPPPEAQVWLLSFRIDWYWRSYRFGLEYFGRVDHASAEARLADTDRFRELRDGGVLLAPVVHEDLADPDALRSWVRARLITRALELGVAPPR